MTLPLKDQRAIVTGAASGIGRETAIALAAAGAIVVGFDVTLGNNCPVKMLTADVADASAVANAMMAAVGELGRIDIVVNGAGIERPARLADLDMDDFDTMYAVNVRGTALVVKAALPYLAPGARIINLASELAYLGRAGSSAYCATKGAVLSMTRSWARELAPDIRVNAVAPGPIDTPLLGYETMTPGLQALER